MKKKKHIDIVDAYQSNPEKADLEIWGREYESGRRGFLKKSVLATMGAVLGGNIVFGKWMPAGLMPIGILDKEKPFVIPGKSDQLVILNKKPINAEVPPHLLNDFVTPNDLMFVRNNGIPPLNPDPDKWILEIEGESAESKLSFSIKDLKEKFQHHTYNLTLECGGNGRSEFNPPASGNQWTTGAVGCAKWTGVRLRDVLESVGIKKDAVYIGYYGADTHLSGDPDKVVISRGVPMAKALEDETLIAWKVNDKDIPLLNGYPLRLVVGGWPASCSGKWLKKIVIRNKVHDGPKMTGKAYRVPCKPVEPGAHVEDSEMCIIESMPVKSLITYPKSGGLLSKSSKLKVNGKAWAGDLEVKEMHVSIDFGQSWQKANLKPAVNRLAWQEWDVEINFPGDGYYEVWARATDSNGMAQPNVVPGWNPKGYLNNACHRIAVKVKRA